MADWLADNWRDILSIAGLVVSVSGFSIAIWQIVRSRKAAEAAEIAVLATKESIAKNLTISDLVRASERIQEVRNLQRQGQWERALDRYYNLRIILFDISAQQPDLAVEKRLIRTFGEVQDGIQLVVANDYL